jgi:hypothetical protein
MVPPDQAGSVGNGSLGTAVQSAVDHRVSTSASRMRRSARLMALGTGVTESDPQGGQFRGQRPDRDHQAPTQPRDGRVAVHHRGVRQDVRAVDVEGPVGTGRDADAAAARYRRTSRIAIGWMRLRTQRGVIITGSRS